MKIFRQIFELSLLYLILITQKADAGLSGPGVACLDNDVDLAEGYFIPDGGFNGIPMIYAEDASSLPNAVQGKLEGRGIFYSVGNLQTAGGLLRFSESPHNVPSPAYMYVKYYGHVVGPNSGQRMSVYPALYDNDDGRYNLASTTGFKWAEQLVQIDLFNNNSRINVHEQFFGGSDIFLLEKVILSYGQEVNGIDEILSLCPQQGDGTTVSPQPPATDEPTTEVGVGTSTENPGSTPPPQNRPCTQPGYAADPEDCSKFHQCRYDDEGKLIDSVFTCPQLTVWCQEELRCEYAEICPCDL